MCFFFKKTLLYSRDFLRQKRNTNKSIPCLVGGSILAESDNKEVNKLVKAFGK